MLYASFEKVDITPFDLKRTYLAGFDINRTAKGVLDPLWARILYLTDGATQLALVVCDLLGMPNYMVNEIRSRIPELKPEEIHIFCTHVHSGPDLIGLWGPGLFNVFPLTSGVDENYKEWLISEITYGIRRATLHPERVAPYFAKGELINELDGRKVIDNVRQPDFFDKTLSMLVFKTKEGRILATLCHLGVHPETLWRSNRLISSDIFDPLRREIEKSLNTNALIFNGALGGMVTSAVDDKMRLAQRYVWMQRAGKFIGEQFVALTKKAQKLKIDAIKLKVKKVCFPLENELLYFMLNLGVVNRSGAKEIETEVLRIKLGEVEIFGLPGEVLPAVGEEIKKASKAKHPLVFSLANDELGYILPPEYFDNKKYRYECSMSVSKNTAHILLEALKSLD